MCSAGFREKRARSERPLFSNRWANEPNMFHGIDRNVYRTDRVLVPGYAALMSVICHLHNADYIQRENVDTSYSVFGFDYSPTYLTFKPNSISDRAAKT
jgi:hypothetical protein